MTNSNQSLNNQLENPRNKRFAIWFLVIGFIGFVDAVYLTTNHFLGIELNCGILKGCEQVTTSVYASVWGIPVALLGLIYYLFIILSSILYLDIKKELVLRFISRVTILGLIASLWFLFAQIFLIHALCTYCLISLITSSILFIIGVLFLKDNRAEKLR